jgi:class 3 adenylate cyclase/ligand-binding sensor domain-containing protein
MHDTGAALAAPFFRALRLFRYNGRMIRVRILACLFLAAPLAAQQFFVRNINMSHGLPFNQVNFIFQDSAGFLWVGTTLGVSRLDAFLHPFNLQERQGLPANFCTGILEDPHGRLWVKTLNGVAFLERGAQAFTRVKKTSGWHTALAYAESAIWFSSDGEGLYRADVASPKKVTLYDRAADLPSLRIHDLHPAPDGKHWLSTEDGLFLVELGKERLRVLASFLDTIPVWQVQRVRNRFLAATAKGLYALEGGAVLPLDQPPEFRERGVRAVRALKGLWEEETVAVLLPSGERTLYVLRDRTWTPMGREHGLSSGTVACLYQDREGILWLGTDKGLDILTGTAMANYPSEGLGIPDAFLYCVGRVGEEIWIGSRSGMRRIARDGAVLPPPSTLDRPIDFWDFAEWRGSAFAASTGKILRLDGGRVTEFDQAGGKPLGRIYDLEVFGDALLACGQNGLFEFDGTSFRKVPLDPGLTGVFLYSCHVDSAGTVWLCSVGRGLWRVGRDGRTLGRWGEEQGLPGNTVYDLVETDTGMWIGTSAGLVGISHGSGKVVHPEARNGLSGVAVPALELDPQGLLWVGSMGGLVLYDPVKDEARLKITGKSGLLGTDVASSNGLLAPGDGSLWFVSASHGISHYQPSRAASFRPRPTVSIPAVSTLSRTVSPELSGGMVDLSWSESRDLQIAFAILSFRNPDATSLMGYLAPFEKIFRPIEGTGSLRYTSLAPGDYTFHLKAAVEGEESPEARLFIGIAPPWWRTWWAACLCVLLVASAGFGFFRWRVRALKLRQRELEQLVEARTRDLMEEKEKVDKAYVLLSAEREKSEALLLNVLPAPIAERLKSGQNVIADHFDEVTVLFADIVDFTKLSARISPVILVGLLDEIFQAFDTLAEKHRLEKIKTIGDAYMVVGGLPVPRPDHAQAVAAMALDMREALAALSSAVMFRLNIRIGIHSGPVVSGVIGKRKFIYDLWGDTVNTASRMESHSLPGEIQVSEAVFERIREEFVCEAREAIIVKGKGEMRTWWLKGRKQ